MYGKYGRDRNQPSTRYRDLVDLAIIITNQELNAADSRSAARRGEKAELALPGELTAPSAQWRAGYQQSAAAEEVRGDAPAQYCLGTIRTVIGFSLGGMTLKIG